MSKEIVPRFRFLNHERRWILKTAQVIQNTGSRIHGNH